MVLLNKHALASFDFNAPSALLFFQCALAVVLVKICELLGFVKQLQPLKKDLVLIWFPVNLIFVGMIGTSFYALQTVGVGMVTVWKNLRCVRQPITPASQATHAAHAAANALGIGFAHSRGSAVSSFRWARGCTVHHRNVRHGVCGSICQICFWRGR